MNATHDSAALPAILKARARERLDRLRKQKELWPVDLNSFAAEALVIRPKDPLTGEFGAARKFELNSVQRKLDALLDNQLAETGQVRAIILKARQLGIKARLARGKHA